MTVSRLAPKEHNIGNIPHMLRSLAERIEAGEFHGLERLFVIVNADALELEHYGKPCTPAEMVGVLEFTKYMVLDPE